MLNSYRCAKFKRQIWPYLSGEMDSERNRALLEAHISSCAVCRIEMAKKRDSVSKLIDIGSPLMKSMAAEVVIANQVTNPPASTAKLRTAVYGLTVLLVLGYGLSFVPVPKRFNVTAQNLLAQVKNQPAANPAPAPVTPAVASAPIAEAPAPEPKQATPEEVAKTMLAQVEQSGILKPIGGATQQTANASAVPTEELTPQTETIENKKAIAPAVSANVTLPVKATVKKAPAPARRVTRWRPAKRTNRRVVAKARPKTNRVVRRAPVRRSSPAVTVYSPSGKVVGRSR